MSMNNHNSGSSEDRQVLPVKMTLLSDTIFGSGMSIPGEEDVSVLTDDQGFPYYKGSTFKGIFREEMSRCLEWESQPEDKGAKQKTDTIIRELFGEGKPGADVPSIEARRLVFSDFVLSPHVRSVIYGEIGNDPGKVIDCLSNVRAFTRVNEEGTAAKGSLRYARCINQGLVFYSTISCAAVDKALVEKILPFVKWIGTLRNRGFGYVRIEVEDDMKSNIGAE